MKLRLLEAGAPHLALRGVVTSFILRVFLLGRAQSFPPP
jgi:hypothetical protein